MLFALSTGHQIGLAATGAAFILFALVSSFVLPRIIPDFPTRKGLRWYLPLTALFFVAMMASILILAKEKKTAEAAPATTSGATTTGATTTGGTTTGATTTGVPRPGVPRPGAASSRAGPTRTVTRPPASRSSSSPADAVPATR